MCSTPKALAKHKKMEKLLEYGPKEHKMSDKALATKGGKKVWISSVVRNVYVTISLVIAFFVYSNGVEAIQVPLTWELNGLHKNEGEAHIRAF